MANPRPRNTLDEHDQVIDRFTAETWAVVEPALAGVLAVPLSPHAKPEVMLLPWERVVIAGRDPRRRRLQGA